MDVRTRSGKKQGHCPRCEKWRALTKAMWYANRTTGEFMPPCRPCRLEMGAAWRASRNAVTPKARVLRERSILESESVFPSEAGEIHHAVAANIMRREDVAGELGDVILGKVPGRRTEQDITVCDLTGVGVQDAAVAALAIAPGAGRLHQGLSGYGP